MNKLIRSAFSVCRSLSLEFECLKATRVKEINEIVNVSLLIEAKSKKNKKKITK